MYKWQFNQLYRLTYSINSVIWAVIWNYKRLSEIICVRIILWLEGGNSSKRVIY